MATHYRKKGRGQSVNMNRESARLGAWPAIKRRPTARETYSRSGKFFIVDAVNYGLVIVRPQTSPPEVEIRFVGLDNAVRHTRTLRASV